MDPVVAPPWPRCVPRLEKRLGHDLAPHVVAKEAMKKLRHEVSRLRDEAVATVEETTRRGLGRG